MWFLKEIKKDEFSKKTFLWKDWNLLEVWIFYLSEKWEQISCLRVKIFSPFFKNERDLEFWKTFYIKSKTKYDLRKFWDETYQIYLKNKLEEFYKTVKLNKFYEKLKIIK